MAPTRMAVAYCVHDDHWLLESSIRSFQAGGDVHVFVSRLPWNGEAGDWQRAVEAAEAAGASVVLGDWPAEILHRQGAAQWLIDRGYTHAMLPDSDEVVDRSLLEAILGVANSGVAQRVYVEMDTYWKSKEFVIRPRERLSPLMMVELAEVWPNDVSEFTGRLYGGGKAIQLSAEFGVIHHLSYVGPNERIWRKIHTWSHRLEVVPDWWNRVWLAWDRDPLMRDLHPTHPYCYGFAERIAAPACLESVPDFPPSIPTIQPNERWPKVSVIVPLYGGEREIRACLGSLEKCADLLHETIVVDDVSPDAAAEIAEEYADARVVRNEKNLGFAGACNRGYRESKGDVVVFLNSDTIVPRAGLIRLVEALQSSGTIGATGPLSNFCGYHQQIDATITEKTNIERFAETFASRPVLDEEVPMLVGFCLAACRSVLDEVGGAFDEGFVRGMYEDNDLCYRLLRAGYRLVLAKRAFVYHEGHRSLARLEEPPSNILKRNESYYFEKWREDLETGFASHLPGTAPKLVAFRPELRPDVLRQRLRERARIADISLCMIVRNEERVLGDCLKSATDAFTQMVVVDTGSTDRTIEIARAAGAEVVEMPWPDSFAAARNVSLQRATGDWLFWLDADDTLPLTSAVAVVEAALGAPREVVGFVVPVQFVGDPEGGTRVDHVKLFRNLPGVEFEGRIHEQVLPSLRRSGGVLRRLDAVVLHSGYDTSPAGQARKNERDWHLLGLELEERPDHPFVHFNAGMTAHFDGDHDKAIHHLMKCVELAEPTESHVRKAYSLMGISMREQGHLEQALDAFREGLDRVGEDPELRFQGGTVLNRLGRFSEAQDWYEMVREDGSYFTSVDRGIFGYKLRHNLASVHAAQGRYREAVDHYRAAIASAPFHAQSAVELFELSMANGDPGTAQYSLDALKAAEGEGERWAAFGARLAESQGGSALQWLQEASSRHAWAVGPPLLIARSLLEQGREGEARPYLKRLQRLGNAEGSFYLGVSAIRQGEYETALSHMRESLRLNPGHSETMGQVEKLEAVLDSVGAA